MASEDITYQYKEYSLKLFFNLLLKLTYKSKGSHDSFSYLLVFVILSTSSLIPVTYTCLNLSTPSVSPSFPYTVAPNILIHKNSKYFLQSMNPTIIEKLHSLIDRLDVSVILSCHINTWRIHLTSIKYSIHMQSKKNNFTLLPRLSNISVLEFSKGAYLIQ